MAEILRILNREYRKVGHGVFEVALQDLEPLRFLDVPYYSTVEITDLPGSHDSFGLAMSATHGGGPGGDDFHIFIHVSFWHDGIPSDPTVRAACDRRLRHIRRHFRRVVDSGLFDDGDGDDSRNRLKGGVLCSIMYSKQFSREDNPILAEVLGPFVERFKDLLVVPELLLFICHSSEDKDFVDQLAAYLDSRAVSLWYDKREIRVGDSIVARISEGLDAASHLVVVLSNASVRKPWVQKELSSALMKQLKDRSITIAPVLREECSIPPLLTDIKYADCRFDAASGFRQLVDDVVGVALS